jgi:hypothetical protein
VLANVRRPGANELGESRPIAGEERSERFLEARSIAGHHGHELIGRLSRSPDPIHLYARPASLIHQPPQRHGRSPRLLGKPIPVAREERHLSSHDA